MLQGSGHSMLHNNPGITIYYQTSKIFSSFGVHMELEKKIKLQGSSRSNTKGALLLRYGLDVVVVVD